MIGLVLFLAFSAVAFGGGYAILVQGMRNGDRLGDATVAAAKPYDGGMGISFVVHNPSSQPVLIGASVRRRSPRRLGESGQSVTVPRRTSRARLLATRHTVVCAIPAGEARSVVVPFSAPIRRRAELVVAIGDPDRLRVVRQAVVLPRASRETRGGYEDAGAADARSRAR